MFWNPFKIFTKKQEETNSQKIHSWICYGIDDDGLSIDINIDSISEKSLDQFAKLLAGISTMSLVPETLAMIKDGLANHPDEYALLIEMAIDYAKKEINNIIEDIPSLQSEDKDEPVIKPSDIIK